MKKILMIEDDENLGSSLKKSLEMEGFAISWAKSIGDAKELINQLSIDLIILDWMLTDGQGIDFLRDFRQEDKATPVLMLTARTDLIDKVLGLETGANDFIVKPFESRELIARIRVHFRNWGPGAAKTANNSDDEEISEQIVIDNLIINLPSREVTFKGEIISLTKMEFNLLTLLAQNPSRIFSRENLLDKVWGYDNYPTTRTVDTHVLQLRQKLTDNVIETIRGIGYRFGYAKKV